MKQAIGAFEALNDGLQRGTAYGRVDVGDSLTVANIAAAGGASPTWGVSLTDWVREQYNNPAYYHNTVAAGGRTSRAIRNIYAADVLTRAEEHVNLGLLTNDFREATNIPFQESVDNVTWIIEQTIAAGKVLTIWGVPPRYKEVLSVNGERRQRLGRILPQLCAEYNIPYVGMNAELQKLYQSGAYNIQELSIDQSHYGQRGNDIHAGVMFKEWYAFDDVTIGHDHNRVMALTPAIWQDNAADSKIVEYADFATIEIAPFTTVKFFIYNDNIERPLALSAMPADDVTVVVNGQSQLVDISAGSGLTSFPTGQVLLGGPNIVCITTGATAVQIHSVGFDVSDEAIVPAMGDEYLIQGNNQDFLVIRVDDVAMYPIGSTVELFPYDSASPLVGFSGVVLRWSPSNLNIVVDRSSYPSGSFPGIKDTMGVIAVV